MAFRPARCLPGPRARWVSIEPSRRLLEKNEFRFTGTDEGEAVYERAAGG